MIAIITSTKDHASMNIRENLLENYDWCEDGSYHNHPVFSNKNVKLYLTDKELVNCDDLDIEAELFIFASKHKSQAGRPSLSVHAPGNWGDARLGGKPGMLCIAPAPYLKAMFLELLNHDTEHEITVEQTHHGPYIDKACLFIEIGSVMEHWEDKNLGKIIADTIMTVLRKPPVECRTAILLGGGHYNHGVNKIMQQTDIAVGHICAKFMLENLNTEIMKQAIKKHTTKVDMIILDWKGLGRHKTQVSKILEEVDIETVRLKTIFNE